MRESWARCSAPRRRRARLAAHGPGQGAWQDIGLRGRSEPDDAQGGVVGGAAGWQQFEQNGVGKGFGVDSRVADEGVPVDAISATMPGSPWSTAA
ncbi:hypothetical protein [Streptomyces sp. NBC_01578]|uniref:hypothetical protein n=1 Tax=unclassified Streptomyces TaxID=2593676 RepID=UPI0038638311